MQLQPSVQITNTYPRIRTSFSRQMESFFDILILWSISNDEMLCTLKLMRAFPRHRDVYRRQLLLSTVKDGFTRAFFKLFFSGRVIVTHGRPLAASIKWVFIVADYEQFERESKIFFELRDAFPALGKICEMYVDRQIYKTALSRVNSYPRRVGIGLDRYHKKKLVKRIREMIPHVSRIYCPLGECQMTNTRQCCGTSDAKCRIESVATQACIGIEHADFHAKRKAKRALSFSQPMQP